MTSDSEIPALSVALQKPLGSTNLPPRGSGTTDSIQPGFVRLRGRPCCPVETTTGWALDHSAVSAFQATTEYGKRMQLPLPRFWGAMDTAQPHSANGTTRLTTRCHPLVRLFDGRQATGSNISTAV